EVDADRSLDRKRPVVRTHELRLDNVVVVLARAHLLPERLERGTDQLGLELLEFRHPRVLGLDRRRLALRRILLLLVQLVQQTAQLLVRHLGLPLVDACSILWHPDRYSKTI